MRRCPLFSFLLLAACSTSDDARTLDNCETSIDDGAPAFFRDLYACVDITVTDDTVVVTTVDLPPHPSPYYETSSPNHEAFDDRGGEWHQNPNTLAEQSLTVTIPLEPTERGVTVTADMVDLEAGTSDDEYPGGQGVSLDGTIYFSGTAAPGDDIAQEKYTFDTWEAHPEGTGVYHHHGATPAPLAVLVDKGYATTTTPGSAEVEIFGIMCDGTVLLGCTEADGSDPDTSDLDAQDGHVHDIVGPDGDTWFSGRYHIHTCDAFSAHPYSPEIQYYEGCETPR